LGRKTRGSIFAALVKARRLFQQPEWIGFIVFPAFIIIIVPALQMTPSTPVARHRARGHAKQA
jgi:hypothetical protein